MSEIVDAQDKSAAQVSIDSEIAILREKFATSGGFDKAAVAALAVAACEKFYGIYPMAHENRDLQGATDTLCEREKRRVVVLAKAAREPFLPPKAPERPIRVYNVSELTALPPPTAQEESWAGAEEARAASSQEISDVVWDAWDETVLRLRDERVRAGTLKPMLTLQQGKPERGIRLLPFNALAATATPPEWQVAARVAVGDKVIVTGDSGSGKTTIEQQRAICIAIGRDFAGQRVKRGKVVWIAGEDIENSKQRFLAYAEDMCLTPEELALMDQNLFVWPGRVSILDPDHPALAQLHADIAETCGVAPEVSAFFFDTKSMLWGGVNENSNDECAEFLRKVDEQFVYGYGRATCYIIHHLNRGGLDKPQQSRGGSALINNADQELRYDKVQGGSRVHPGEKVRMADWGQDYFTIRQYALDATKYPQYVDKLTGEVRSISVATPTNRFGVVLTPKKSALEELRVKVLEAVADSDLTRAEIGVRVGLMRKGKKAGEEWGDSSQVLDRLKALHEQRLVRIDDKKRCGYSITPAGRELIDPPLNGGEPATDSESSGNDE